MRQALMATCRAAITASTSARASSASSPSSFGTLASILVLQRWRWGASPRLAAQLTRNPRHFKALSFRRTPCACFFSFSAKWDGDQSPYDLLGVEWNVDEDGIKSAYRRLAKQYHPDVYDGSIELEEGETPEARFIKIQAAYELLIDKEERRQYDYDNRVNPLKASKAWMEWMLKKKKAFEQRGDMAVSAWAEQQQREMSLKARRLSKYKMDPEEERRILTREKQALALNFESTLRRHTLVLKKRDLMRRKTDPQAQKKLVEGLLAAEGLELAESDDE